MSIKRDLTSGIFYTSVAKYSGIVISLVITSILSRLLTPEDFGIVAVASVIIVFFNILGDIGIGPAIIQHKGLTDEDINHIYSFTIYLGAALSAVFAALAHPIAEIYEDPTLTGVCRWLSLSIFFTCFGSVPMNLRYKNKEFKNIAGVTLAVQVLTGAVSIFFAYMGGGVYALVLSSVLSTGLLAVVYNLMAGLKFRPLIKMEPLRKIASFSSYQFLSNLVAYLSGNLDKLLVGKLINLTQLGFYEKSYKLMMMPLQNISFVINPVMLPIFSELQTDVRELGQKYFVLLKLLAFIAFPLGAILYFCGPELILIIFGPQWEESVAPFEILTFSVAIQILASTAYPIFQAANATKMLFVSRSWGAVFMVGAFCASIFGWGSIEAVSYGYLIGQIASTVQCFHALCRVLRTPVAQFYRMLVLPVAMSAVLFAAMWAISPLAAHLPMLPALLVKGIAGTLLSLALVQLSGAYDIVGFVKGRLRKRA